MGEAVTSSLVTVVLPVHNSATDLPVAIQTILAQTFTDFELLAINNGSTHGTAAVLNGLRDPRVLKRTEEWNWWLRWGQGRDFVFIVQPLARTDLPHHKRWRRDTSAPGEGSASLWQ
jgi:glycosyltransferase involved in cell wall biosynthesis